LLNAESIPSKSNVKAFQLWMENHYDTRVNEVGPCYRFEYTNNGNRFIYKTIRNYQSGYLLSYQIGLLLLIAAHISNPHLKLIIIFKRENIGAPNVKVNRIVFTATQPIAARITSSAEGIVNQLQKSVANYNMHTTYTASSV